MAWLSRDLIKELRLKMEMYGHWKQGREMWEDYRDAARLCRERIHMANARVEE